MRDRRMFMKSSKGRRRNLKSKGRKGEDAKEGFSSHPLRLPLSALCVLSLHYSGHDVSRWHWRLAASTKGGETDARCAGLYVPDIITGAIDTQVCLLVAIVVGRH